MMYTTKLHWGPNSALIGMVPKRAIRAKLDQHLQILG